MIVVHDGFEGKGFRLVSFISHFFLLGQSLLDRQRRVSECLKEEMTQIHALQMKTWTRQQYETKMKQSVPNN